MFHPYILDETKEGKKKNEATKARRKVNSGTRKEK
jgi:hypothetical protein